MGLSSLGRGQSYVLTSVNQDIMILSKLLDEEYVVNDYDKNALTFHDAREIMIKNSKVSEE